MVGLLRIKMLVQVSQNREQKGEVKRRSTRLLIC
jgi:hypothetical protein